MGRSRRRNNVDKTIEDLLEEIKRLEEENTELRSRLAGSSSKDKRKREKKTTNTEPECPNCGAKIKESKLPFGKLRLCSNACGWKDVTKD